VCCTLGPQPAQPLGPRNVTGTVVRMLEPATCHRRHWRAAPDAGGISVLRARCFPREGRLEAQSCVNGAGLSSHGRARLLALALHEPQTPGHTGRRLPPESGVAHSQAALYRPIMAAGPGPWESRRSPRFGVRRPWGLGYGHGCVTSITWLSTCSDLTHASGSVIRTSLSVWR
jgi:hypothetical protein